MAALPEERLERNYRIFFWIALTALALGVVAALATVVDVPPSAPAAPAGAGRETPLAILAALMAVSWMPMFMPVLLPIVAALAAFWYGAALAIAGGRWLVHVLSRRATSATIHWSRSGRGATAS